MPVLLAPDEGAPKVLFRCKGVVGVAIHHQISCAIVATERKRVLVVQLQQPGFSTASTQVIDKRAARPMVIEYLSPHRRRHRLALARSSGSVLESTQSLGRSPGGSSRTGGAYDSVNSVQFGALGKVMLGPASAPLESLG
jgi:hypothetical protein